MTIERTLFTEGRIPRSRSPDFWSMVLSELMELFAFGALYLTAEIQAWPFLMALGLSAFRFLSKFRLRTLWIVAGFLGLAFLGFQLSVRFQLEPVVAAAHVAPIALGWIGISRAAGGLWGWRMGMGFISLILASALSPDFSVTIFIVCFIVAGSVALACRFLSEEFARRGITGTLPKGFIRTSVKQSGILFIAALIIFPLIPRVQGRSGTFGNETPKTGYTEEVNLNEWTRVSSKGSSATALRIYGPEGKDPTQFIPAGLLRSRVLSVLGDGRWDPPPVHLEMKHYLDSTNHPLPVLTFVREMVGPANVAVPYGTRHTGVELYGYRWGAEKTKNEEWREGRSRNQRYTYRTAIELDSNLKPQDPPTKADLYVPENFRSDRMKKFADRLFKNVRNAHTKIGEVQNFYQVSGFKALYAEDEPAKATQPGEDRIPPIERFLFIEKSGHCELFASGLAILLRMGGVPARLVAGFRVSRNSVGDVLTVRQSDAHAWVEAYIPGEGWNVIDPTPKILQTFALMDWVSDTYDWASAKWAQYILNYGEGESSVRAKWDAFKKGIENLKSGKNPFESTDSDANVYLFVVVFTAGAALFSFLSLFLFRKIRKKSSIRKEDRTTILLIRERAKIEKILLKYPGAAKAVEEWMKDYENVRFGLRSGNENASIEALQKARTSIEARMKNNTAN